jgi:transcription factor C subunit 7
MVFVQESESGTLMSFRRRVWVSSAEAAQPHSEPPTQLHPRPGSAESLQAYFPEVAPDGWRTVYYPPKAGEDVAEVHERARACLGALLPRLGAHTRVALFTHAATAITLARALLADARAPLRVGCCTISVFDRAPDAPGDAALGPGLWVPERLADGSHLKEGALRDWGFEDILINESGHVSPPSHVRAEVPSDGSSGRRRPRRARDRERRRRADRVAGPARRHSQDVT